MSTQVAKRENGQRAFPNLLSELFDTDRFFDLDFPVSKFSPRLPAVNIRETNKDFVIEMAAPGLSKDDFKINIENHTLSITAEKEEEKEEKDGRYTRKEYNYNSFARSFALPDYVEAHKVDAKYEEGVLKLKIPKKETSKAEETSKQVKVH